MFVLGQAALGAIPVCNATNFHEFWCTVVNVTESFPALATRLHVNPTKLCEYNFLYACGNGVVPGDSIRARGVELLRS